MVWFLSPGRIWGKTPWIQTETITGLLLILSYPKHGTLLFTTLSLTFCTLSLFSRSVLPHLSNILSLPCNASYSEHRLRVSVLSCVSANLRRRMYNSSSESSDIFTGESVAMRWGDKMTRVVPSAWRSALGESEFRGQISSCDSINGIPRLFPNGWRSSVWWFRVVRTLLGVDLDFSKTTPKGMLNNTRLNIITLLGFYCLNHNMSYFELLEVQSWLLIS